MCQWHRLLGVLLHILEVKNFLLSIKSNKNGDKNCNSQYGLYVLWGTLLISHHWMPVSPRLHHVQRYSSNSAPSTASHGGGGVVGCCSWSPWDKGTSDGWWKFALTGESRSGPGRPFVTAKPALSLAESTLHCPILPSSAWSYLLRSLLLGVLLGCALWPWPYLCKRNNKEEALVQY